MELDTGDWSAFYRGALTLDAEVDASVHSWLQSIDRLVSHVFAPSFGSLAALWIGESQLHRQARVAIAIRAYEHSLDELPNTLDALPGSIARLHPFGNKPFGYELEIGRAVLWGFDPTRDVRETPASPSTSEAGVLSDLDNYRFVWQIEHHAK